MRNNRMRLFHTKILFDIFAIYINTMYARKKQNATALSPKATPGCRISRAGGWKSCGGNDIIMP